MMRVTTKLGIPKQDFIELYPHADHEIFFRDPKSDIEFIERYLTNKLWRLNNLYTITNKMGEVVPFIMNSSQHAVYKASLLHSRLLILKSRQQGISTFWLLSYFDDSIFNDHYDIGLMSQGRAESGTLLTRTKLAWSKLDGSIKSFLNIALKKDNADEVGISNGSTIFIRTSFRSATLQRLHISEYGKICNKYPERARETKTGTMQAIAPGNTLVIESTAEGHNDFKAMWDKAYGKELKTLGPKEFYAVFLSWLDDDTCVSSVDRIPTPEQEKYFEQIEFETGRVISQQQKNFWIDQFYELEENAGMVNKEGDLSSSSIYQEYPSTPEEAFKSIRDGAYYAHAYEKYVIKRHRKIPNLWDHNLPVEVSVDLGMDDFFVLCFYQVWDGEYRIIHEYVNNGKGIKHYCKYMLGWDDELNKETACKDYDISIIHLPWDAVIRDLSVESGLSRKDRFYEVFRELFAEAREKKIEHLMEKAIPVLLLLPKLGVNTGIELVRKMIPDIWIDETCTYLDSCFFNYSKKWNDPLQKWDDSPAKSDFNHGADVIRGMAVSKEAGKDTIHTKQSSKKKRKSSQVVDGLAI